MFTLSSVPSINDVKYVSNVVFDWELELELTSIAIVTFNDQLVINCTTATPCLKLGSFMT